MELYHHGVKGQKWGVRRYQNEDGSYKHGAEGRYYTKEDAKKILKKADKAVTKISNTVTKIADKTVSDAKKELNEAFGIKGKSGDQKTNSQSLTKKQMKEKKAFETYGKYGDDYSNTGFKESKKALKVLKERHKILDEDYENIENKAKELSQDTKKYSDKLREINNKIESEVESLMKNSNDENYYEEWDRNYAKTFEKYKKEYDDVWNKLDKAENKKRKAFSDYYETYCDNILKEYGVEKVKDISNDTVYGVRLMVEGIFNDALWDYGGDVSRYGSDYQYYDKRYK